MKTTNTMFLTVASGIWYLQIVIECATQYHSAHSAQSLIFNAQCSLSSNCFPFNSIKFLHYYFYFHLWLVTIHWHDIAAHFQLDKFSYQSCFTHSQCYSVSSWNLFPIIPVCCISISHFFDAFSSGFVFWQQHRQQHLRHLIHTQLATS